MALAEGREPSRQIAARYGLSTSSVHRHATTHVPRTLASIAERVGILESDQLLAQSLQLYERSLELLAEAESNVARSANVQDKARALAAATGAIREARHTIDTLARVNLAARQDVQASEQADSTVQSVRPDLDAEITEALRRRGMPSTGPRAQRSADPPPMLQLPAPAQADEIAEAELVD